jgi:hypothetical protein
MTCLSGRRPSNLPKDKQEELHEVIAKQNQQVWAARHTFIILLDGKNFSGDLYANPVATAYMDDLGYRYAKFSDISAMAMTRQYSYAQLN